MEITFIGHSGFRLGTKTKTLLIDPYLTDNPVNSFTREQFSPDLILVTHGHSDHLGDAIEISRNTNALIVSNVELANYCRYHGAKAHGMNLGGSHTFEDVNIKMTLALHSSSIGTPAHYLGNPAGFVINADNLTVYHSGDTGLFGDMSLLGKLHSIDIALLPIGDNFTMGPADALEAIKMLKPKLVIPMHYNTWPLITQDAEAFKRIVEQQTLTQVKILSPGTSFSTESI